MSFYTIDKLKLFEMHSDDEEQSEEDDKKASSMFEWRAFGVLASFRMQWSDEFIVKVRDGRTGRCLKFKIEGSRSCSSPSTGHEIG
jgi:hypothetical protein